MAGPLRLFTVYLVTARVTLSYLGLAVARRFRSPEAVERLTQVKHRRNARRIEAAILRLRGLFIKVGQLISIMANVLPDAFREELQRLQDQVPARPYRDAMTRDQRSKTTTAASRSTPATAVRGRWRSCATRSCTCSRRTRRSSRAT